MPGEKRLQKSHLISEDEILFIDLLERKPLGFGLPVFDEVDGTVGPITDQLDDVKIVFGRLLEAGLGRRRRLGHQRIRIALTVSGD